MTLRIRLIFFFYYLFIRSSCIHNLEIINWLSKSLAVSKLISLRETNVCMYIYIDISKLSINAEQRERNLRNMRLLESRFDVE